MSSDPIIFDLQQGIKFLFAYAGSLQEDGGKRALWHPQGIAEGHIQGAFAINTKDFMQLIQYVGMLFNMRIGFTIIHDPFCPRATAPFDLAGTVIAADEGHRYAPILLSFPYEL